jgi:hypothetical protein
MSLSPMRITDERPEDEITANPNDKLVAAFRSRWARLQPWRLQSLDVHRVDKRVIVTVDVSPFGSGQFSLSLRAAALLKLKLMQVLGS